MAKMTEQEMFTAIIKAVDEGRITIEALPGSAKLKQNVREFIEARDKL